jgi:hypothetical protein
MTYDPAMTMNPKARAPRPKSVELPARVYADPEQTARMDPLSMLTFGKATRLALDYYEHEVATAARKAGATWQEIGAALGIPRQNAQRKFSRPNPVRWQHGPIEPKT